MAKEEAPPQNTGVPGGLAGAVKLKSVEADCWLLPKIDGAGAETPELKLGAAPNASDGLAEKSNLPAGFVVADCPNNEADCGCPKTVAEEAAVACPKILAVVAGGLLACPNTEAPDGVPKVNPALVDVTGGAPNVDAVVVAVYSEVLAAPKMLPAAGAVAD